MHFRYSLLGLWAVLSVTSCENESGVYLDHKKQEIRLNGERITVEEFTEFAVATTNSDVPVTILGEDGRETTSVGELQEGLRALPEVFLSYDGPESYFEPGDAGADSGDDSDPFADTKMNVEQGGAGQSATHSESNSEGGDKPQPESESRPR
ncbi:hypothetical protein [Luteolibacter marinus]|uniref:hypothetical protein n=1 Tax=Luteolibacter marinus TaxID=2776705 RepID=UPI0018686EFF|nr:hypothetical protein [Luteolibacter marinus]